MVFKVNYDTKSVDVSLASVAHTRLSAKAAGVSPIRRGGLTPEPPRSDPGTAED